MSLFVDIEKSFPDFKLSVRLEGENQVIALLGGSGCGKSLTLKCIAGIETPDRGRIVINGETVFDSEKRICLPPQRRRVGYLFQNYALFPTMTVWNNIASVIKKPRREKTRIVAGMIDSFQLESVKNLYPRQISGGQQQRVALARILVSEPQIMLLDEPFSALDTHLKWTVEQEIASVLAEFHGTTIFVSHNRDEAYRISDTIAVMHDGKIESFGAKESIFSAPKTLAAARMTGCKNISRAEKVDDFRIKATDWGIVLQTEHLIPDYVNYVGVRAHHFQHASALAESVNTFPCRVHQVIEEPFERIFVFSFDTGKDKGARLHFEQPKDLGNAVGNDDLTLCVPANCIMCLES